MSLPPFLSQLYFKIGSRFENYVYELLRKEFGDYTIHVQARLDSGIIPDFVLEGERDLIVVDAKAKEFLQKSDIDQVIGYIQELDGDSAKIYVDNFTEIPDSIGDYAARNAIDIEYTDWGTK